MIPQTGSMWIHADYESDDHYGRYVVDCVALSGVDLKTLHVVYRPTGPDAREGMKVLKERHARAFMLPLSEWSKVVTTDEGQKRPQFRPA